MTNDALVYLILFTSFVLSLLPRVKLNSPVNGHSPRTLTKPRTTKRNHQSERGVGETGGKEKGVGETGGKTTGVIGEGSSGDRREGEGSGGDGRENNRSEGEGSRGDRREGEGSGGDGRENNRSEGEGSGRDKSKGVGSGGDRREGVRTECDGGDRKEELFCSSDRGGEEESEGVCGDSIVRKTDRVLNKGDDVVVCLPGAKIEAITERVKSIVCSGKGTITITLLLLLLHYYHYIITITLVFLKGL